LGIQREIQTKKRQAKASLEIRGEGRGKSPGNKKAEKGERFSGKRTRRSIGAESGQIGVKTEGGGDGFAGSTERARETEGIGKMQLERASVL